LKWAVGSPAINGLISVKAKRGDVEAPSGASKPLSNLTAPEVALVRISNVDLAVEPAVEEQKRRYLFPRLPKLAESKRMAAASRSRMRCASYRANLASTTNGTKPLRNSLPSSASPISAPSTLAALLICRISLSTCRVTSSLASKTSSRWVRLDALCGRTGGRAACLARAVFVRDGTDGPGAAGPADMPQCVVRKVA